MGNTQPCVAPSASCSVSDLTVLVDKARSAKTHDHPEWVQTSGTQTITTDDDRFRIDYRSGVDESDAHLQARSRVIADPGEPSSEMWMTNLLTQNPMGITCLSIICGFCLFLLCSCTYFGIKMCSANKTYKQLILADSELLEDREESEEVSMVES
mmetsp:Transcript_73510/g.128702  ORF Transcript_73510/g.128702 Transcript_73510/m.128702 type:complete len:155 (+) Transcript_73510:55-519(+)